MGVCCGLLKNGGGGGGIALRSISCFVVFSSFTAGCTAVNSFAPLLLALSVTSFFVVLRLESSIVRASSRGGFDVKDIDGRRSHCVISHEDGGFL